MNRHVLSLVLSGLLGVTLNAISPAIQAESVLSLEQVLQGEQRTTAHKQQDAQRLPKSTLQFFHLQPNQKVIDVWPGEGWYTEILAPYLKDNGLLITALAPGDTPEHQRSRSALLDKLANDGDSFGEARIVTFEPATSNIRPVGGVDLVLTDGNASIWLQDGTAEPAFAAFYRALKSGGTLGVIQPHNAAATTETIIARAQGAGFIVDGQQQADSGELALRFKKPLDAPVPSDVVKLVRNE